MLFVIIPSGAYPLAHSLSVAATAIPRRVHRAKRTLASKLLEIAQRSPKDAAALHVMADMVLDRLNAALKVSS